MTAVHRLSRLLCLGAVFSSGIAFAASDAPVDPTPIPLLETGFSLKPPKADNVAYRGMVSFDAAGGPGSVFLYPGYAGIAGLLVGIATHGALVEAGKNSEKTKLQVAADKVLEPYKEVIDGFTNKDLMQRGMLQLKSPAASKLIDSADPGDGWIVETWPVFTMTQDRSALVLENAVTVYAASDPAAIRYRNVVKVVSNVHDDADLQALWGADQGKLLKDESASLFAHSVKLVLQTVGLGASSEPMVEKTFRYSEGKEQRMERAQLVRESCGRAVVKTLRGWLMSIPLRRASDAPAPAECDKAGPFPA